MEPPGGRNQRMSELSRRSAFKTLAAGAAGATVAAGLTGADAWGAPTALPGAPRAEIRRAVSEAARRLGRAVERREGMVSGEAVVLSCRSWDGRVYLYLDESVRGFVAVNASGFAVAAACQAAGRPAAVSCWGHEPEWGGGVGRFEGALLAVDTGDLPEEPSLG